jgi:hypothetical protein
MKNFLIFLLALFLTIVVWGSTIIIIVFLPALFYGAIGWSIWNTFLVSAFSLGTVTFVEMFYIFSFINTIFLMGNNKMKIKTKKGFEEMAKAIENVKGGYSKTFKVEI